MASRKIIFGGIAVVIAVICVVIGIVLWSRQPATQPPTAKKPVPCLGPVELPKAPHWSPPMASLYFVDVYQSVVHRYNPETKEHKMAKVGTEPLAFIIPIKNKTDKFVISYGPYISLLTWDGDSETTTNRVIRPIDRNVYRANEGKVAPSGALFVGTHSPFLSEKEVENGAAGLYAIYKDLKKSKKILENVTVSNGMGWSKDATHFYYIDSLAYTVESFTYNIQTDELSDRRILVNFQDQKIPGVPDGMAIDDEDKLWVTAFGGHQVLRIDPENGEIMQTIHLDALKITSAVFGGKDYSDFYITSGNYQNTKNDTNNYPHSGYIFEINNFTVSGRPGVDFEIDPSFLY